MQRVGVTSTRSSSYVYQDENNAGKNHGARPTGRRTALGDITNSSVFRDPSVASKPQQPKPARLPRPGARRVTSTSEAEDSGAALKQFGQLNITRTRAGVRSGSAARTAPSPTAVNEWDVADQNNAQAVVEYVDEIMEHLKDTESRYVPSPDYMSKQTDINARMRAILVDWLVEVQVKFRLHSEALYLTVNLIDRFLERKMVPRTKLQLVGVTAMLIASKYEEIYPPEVKDFVYITDNTYSREELLHSESSMLAQLSFNVTVPVAPTFLTRYAKVCRADNVTLSLASYYSEVVLAAYEALRFKASMLAAGSLCLALLATGMGRWGSTLTSYTGYTEASLTEVMHMIRQKLVEKGTDPKCQAVVKKYASSRFYQVSKLPLPPN